MLTPARVHELTPRIEEIAAELIDCFAGPGQCEFVSEFALPMPGILIAEQLGLPRAGYKTFRRWADAMLSLAQRRMTVEKALEQAEIELEAQHFLAAEIEQRQARPSDNLISLLVHAHGDDEQPFTSFAMLLDRLDHIELAEPLPHPAHEPELLPAPMKRLPLRFHER
jgi:cytochrome P450